MTKFFTHTKKNISCAGLKEIPVFFFFSGFVLKSDDKTWTYNARSFPCQLPDRSSMNDMLTFWIAEVCDMSVCHSNGVATCFAEQY